MLGVVEAVAPDDGGWLVTLQVRGGAGRGAGSRCAGWGGAGAGAGVASTRVNCSRGARCGGHGAGLGQAQDVGSYRAGRPTAGQVWQRDIAPGAKARLPYPSVPCGACVRTTYTQSCAYNFFLVPFNTHTHTHTVLFPPSQTRALWHTRPRHRLHGCLSQACLTGPSGGAAGGELLEAVVLPRTEWHLTHLTSLVPNFREFHVRVPGRVAVPSTCGALVLLHQL